MADFNKYAPTLKKWEGGWANHPNDPGGATMMGVTLATFRLFYGQERTADELRHITGEQWERIMKTYWDRCKADQIKNQSIAEMLVDWHINAGVAAIKAWQKSILLDADGIIGPKSLGVLNSPQASVIFSRMQDAREKYYRELVRRNPKLGVFLGGWLKRTNSFKFSDQ